MMNSARWQKSLCDGSDVHRREAAFHGLAKSVQELEMISSSMRAQVKLECLVLKFQILIFQVV